MTKRSNKKAKESMKKQGANSASTFTRPKDAVKVMMIEAAFELCDSPPITILHCADAAAPNGHLTKRRLFPIEFYV